MDTYSPAAQRPAMLSLASALSSVSTALRRDECGDWRILGTAGHVYAVPEGYHLIVETATVRGWGVAKRRLNFATLQRDGDTEGAFSLDRLPTPAEAAEIRKVIGVRKRADIAPEQRQAMADRLAMLRAA